MHQQEDGACELALEVDAAGDDCWQRSPKRVRISTGSGAVANTAVSGNSSGKDQQVLSLREMVENWTEAGVVEGPAMVLGQVQQLLVAVEVCIYLPSFVRG
jgi:hypothetical protein